MASSKKRGAFIVLEGIDRSGKSTQSKKLHEHLTAQKIANQLIRYPDRTTITDCKQNKKLGKLLNEYLQCKQEVDDRAIHLIFSANRHEAKQQLLSWLEEGYTVICDRYSYSGTVYTYSKNVIKRDKMEKEGDKSIKSQKALDWEWCKHVDQGLIQPDVVIYLNVKDLATVKNRGEFGNERYENEAMLKQVLKSYQTFLAEDADKKIWSIVDANQAVEDVHKQIVSITLATIESVASKPVQYL
ncbi:hypothetical protein RFI_35294 [Reticulomyxa filosa]|uniref:Thymidylate kinase n=1 Tax=Reticulomyxa filosa TaxID=46433 RepID=X6LN33_RETFI|nr:hypothetical protein RFI_35294 [Reticulomyxa filosa]|eukprot:ETO02135.1 hypothetical protein RFI_35294 [Reticulomyxa filosa]